MAMSQSETEQLLNAALRMSRPELERFVARLLSVKARQNMPSLRKRESELLLEINQGVPKALQQRYNALSKKRRNQTLTSTQHRELLALTKQIEQLDVERLKMLSELARLRGAALPELMRELGIKSPDPDYA